MHSLESILYPVLDSMAALLPEGVCLNKDPRTVLFGIDAVLDSTTLLYFITAAEEQIEKITGRNIRLLTPQAMAAPENPFSTLGTLAAYIDQQLGKGAGA